MQNIYIKRFLYAVLVPRETYSHRITSTHTEFALPDSTCKFILPTKMKTLPTVFSTQLETLSTMMLLLHGMLSSLGGKDK